MAIDVKVSGTPPQEVKREYPYLGRRGARTIVLFTCEKKGILLDGMMEGIGYYCDRWDEKEYTPLSPSESITLSNK